MNTVAASRRIFYGWIIVALCTAIIALDFGLMFSYSVFFKPLADYFGWDRASVSLVYSSSLIIGGAVSIGVGWLADRHSPGKLMAFCGLMIGSGLILSSRVHHLWQLFLTYGVIEATGLLSGFGISAALISRWFSGNRGLPLGILASGSGLGTFLIVPLNERLVDSLGWQSTFLIAGSVAGVLIIAFSFFLRKPLEPARIASTADGLSDPYAVERVPLTHTLADRKFALIMAAFFSFAFSTQLVIIHLVNYATDRGIDTLVATSFVSVIGAISIIGRLASGAGVSRVGTHNTLILTRAVVIVAFVILIFAQSIPAFYVFAVFFSLAYGAEITQIPLILSYYYGTRTIATLVSFNGLCVGVGGALGVWSGGKIFDNTQSYSEAFIIGAVVSVFSLVLMLVLKARWTKKAGTQP